MGGPQFTVITDHKPLVYLFNKGKQDMPARLERFVMGVQGYNFIVEYKPGCNNIADYLSRHSAERKGSSKTDEVEEYANRITDNHYVNVMEQLEAVTKSEVKEETEKCEEMKVLRKAIRTGDYSGKPLARYASAEVRDQLYETRGVIYQGNRVVVPVSLREKVVRVSHRGHQGCAKTKALIREFCWFPHIDKLVERKVGN